MGCYRFSAGNASYIQVYAQHDEITHENIFDKGKISSLDAIILEDSGMGPYAMEYKTWNAKGHPIQYELIGKAAHEANLPVYFLDVETSQRADLISKLMMAFTVFEGVCLAAIGAREACKIRQKRKKGINITRREFLKTGIVGGTGALILGSAAGAGISGLKGEGETSGIAETAGAAFHRINPSPLIELRNAITARKIDEYVVPLLTGRLKRNPFIAIVYGAEHMGIEGCIKNKSWRDAVIKSYSLVDYAGIVKEDLDLVWELLPSECSEEMNVLGLKWDFNKRNCGLFA